MSVENALKVGPKGGNQYEIWYSGSKQADRAAKEAAGIDKVLAEPKSKKGLYEVTPTNQGKKLIEWVRVEGTENWRKYVASSSRCNVTVDIHPREVRVSRTGKCNSSRT